MGRSSEASDSATHSFIGMRARLVPKLSDLPIGETVAYILHSWRFDFRGCRKSVHRASRLVRFPALDPSTPTGIIRRGVPDC
jgi:hypothetical protein